MFYIHVIDVSRSYHVRPTSEAPPEPEPPAAAAVPVPVPAPMAPTRPATAPTMGMGVSGGIPAKWDNEWLLFGFYMVIIWFLYGFYIVIIWLLYGYYMVKINGGFHRPGIVN